MSVTKAKTRTKIFVINKGLENGDDGVVGYILFNIDTCKIKKLAKKDRHTIKLSAEDTQIIYLPPFHCIRVHEKSLNDRIVASRKLNSLIRYYCNTGKDPNMVYAVANINPMTVTELYGGYGAFSQAAHLRRGQIKALLEVFDDKYTDCNKEKVMEVVGIDKSWLARGE